MANTLVAVPRDYVWNTSWALDRLYKRYPQRVRRIFARRVIYCGKNGPTPVEWHRLQAKRLPIP